MGKQITKIIDRFDGGITTDLYEKDLTKARVVKNFDFGLFLNKLYPQRSSGNGDAGAATNKIYSFETALKTTDYRTYGLGVTGTKARVFEDNTLVGNVWTGLTKGDGSSMTSTDFELFIYYQKTGRLYGMSDGTTVWACDPADSANFDESDGSDQYAHTLATAYANPRSASATNLPNIAGGLVHSKDDILYIAYDNIIISNNGTTWTDPALTLPTNKVITSLSEYGNYLAIATRDKSQVGNSVVYLWDRDSSVNDISESIDWGEGNLSILEQLDGVLVGISTSGTNLTQLYTTITFRYYTGGAPVIFSQIISEAVYVLNDLRTTKQKSNNHLYFLAKVTLGGVVQEGLWKVGRHVVTGKFFVVFDRTPNNDTALTTGVLNGFIVHGDVAFISYQDNSVFKMSRSATTTTYSVSAYYETLKITGDDSSKTKQLVGATVMFEPLPTAGTVTLKAKIDEDTTWDVTLFSAFGTDNAIRKSAVRDSSGDSLPHFKELQFQVISYGGAVVTGIKLKYEEIEDDIY